MKEKKIKETRQERKLTFDETLFNPLNGAGFETPLTYCIDILNLMIQIGFIPKPS